MKRFILRIGFQSLFIGVGLLFVSSVQAADPTIDTLVPADQATNAVHTANLQISFDQTVIASGGTLAGTATITIFNNDGTTFEKIGALSGAVTVNGAVVTINPLNDLVRNASYYVQIDDDAFENASDEQFAGISDTTTWNFTTQGSGGAANRALRKKILENMPKHYSMEEPSLLDVGIFTPTEPTEPVRAAAPKEPTKKKEVELPRKVQSRLAAEKRDREMLMKAAPKKNVSRLQERTCARVAKRKFRSKILSRVNERLERRFGFTCSG